MHNCRLLIFSNNYFRNTIEVSTVWTQIRPNKLSNSLDPDQAQHLLGLIWVQQFAKVIKDESSRQRYRNVVDCQVEFSSSCQFEVRTSP